MRKKTYWLTLCLLFIAGTSNAQWAATGNDIYNTNSRYVGIGTSTPLAKLDVRGYVNATRLTLFEEGDNVLCSRQNGEHHQLIGTYSGWDTRGVYVAAYNAGNAAASGGHNYISERIYLGNPTFNGNYLSVNLLNGGVGIGTLNTGTFRLAVEGKIGAREVHVTNAFPWPDYVFKSNYDLKNLYSLEKYVRQNNHLPNIPSAQEVTNNGIELGTMNAKLLEKVEELTLYIIELNKKMDKQQKEINQLKKDRR
jgi:hypothetical protein